MARKFLPVMFAFVFILGGVACGFMGSDKEEAVVPVEVEPAPAAQADSQGKGVPADPFSTDPYDVSMSSESMLQEVADQLNRGLPEMVDSETEWFYTEAEPARLRYKYKLVNIAAGDLDMATFQKDMTTTIIDGACSSAEVRQMFLDEGVTLEYHYVDKYGIFLTSISVNSGHCP